uniref:Gamma-butyrobetaine hydroxylase-like N-terminal domain-containing protein n=1 Tax=Phaeomonas parva TaxID=124430 RepID=A0A7S1UGJ6_9STRA|mmetsp:Transcript_4960/g.14052  ORF Transcript_4960/g.14052 Transcript_4960/m.14052 type:complete len:443 (+) Transcript_4960:152-1480(+)|eukprot:CAMPEP_0118852812 /NCGR_PEP_ID=MMETSP1163-20130328/1647_1 /TAXON_ID=124430 /ORGANISM="Phaeomonas parva, Strain CCMP2877" /LENGTH=442 /DNA_ID=CAMNT_0006785277 /DNA_START=251 /DNA_END=1579 /DNA_ORIENTATION=-
MGYRRTLLAAALCLGLPATALRPRVGRAALRMSALQQSPLEAGEEDQIIGTGIPGVQNIVAVSSCKGGVGKSTTAVNLAYALRDMGHRVGILDADVFGPSLPTMVQPGENVVQMEGNQFIPLEKDGVKLMSLGYVRDGVSIMRGPMVMQLIQQLVTLTAWGELDYLVVDFPPGTGDVQLTLTQALKITAAVIVTTPQRLSFVDVVKGIDMFDTVGVPCVAVVENMAYYEVPDVERMADDLRRRVADEVAGLADASAAAEKVDELIKESLAERPVFKRRRLFGKGHRQRLADMWGIENTVSLPVVDEIAQSGDSGTPYLVEHAESSHASAFRALAAGVAEDVEEMAQAPNGGLPTVESDPSKSNFLTIGDKEISPVELRAMCRCALCVEELTGKPLLDPDTIPADIAPASIARVGRYAFAVDWNDGHKSLYPYRWIIGKDKAE